MGISIPGKTFFIFTWDPGSLDENLAERRQKAHEAFKAHMARVRAQEILDSIPDREVDEDLPPFAKPYRKDGRWIYRPTRPRYAQSFILHIPL